jgi:PadR family transcriptional regulator, regulatory protein PadR
MCLSGVAHRRKPATLGLQYILGRYIVLDTMREPTYFILASLLEERRHGYGIIKEAERLSDGRVVLPAGTLYGALDRLLKAGLVAVDGEEIVDGRARRYYVLTEHGTQELRDEASRLHQAAFAVLKPQRGGASL